MKNVRKEVAAAVEEELSNVIGAVAMPREKLDDAPLRARMSHLVRIGVRIGMENSQTIIKDMLRDDNNINGNDILTVITYMAREYPLK